MITRGTGEALVVSDRLYRAINLNGPSLSFEGKTFEASAQAANLMAGPYSFSDETVTLNPAVTHANKAKMLHSSIFGYGTVGGQVKLSNVPNGNYNVYLYVWEDNTIETYALKLNAQTTESSYVSGPTGTWRKLGPLPGQRHRRKHRDQFIGRCGQLLRTRGFQAVILCSVCAD